MKLACSYRAEVRHTWRMINMRSNETNRRRQWREAEGLQGLGQATQLTSSISIASQLPELACCACCAELGRSSVFWLFSRCRHWSLLIRRITTLREAIRFACVTLQREPLIFSKLNHLFCGNCVATISTLRHCFMASVVLVTCPQRKCKLSWQTNYINAFNLAWNSNKKCLSFLFLFLSVALILFWFLFSIRIKANCAKNWHNSFLSCLTFFTLSSCIFSFISTWNC